MIVRLTWKECNESTASKENYVQLVSSAKLILLKFIQKVWQRNVLEERQFQSG
jgi:hypothetical protein